MSKRTWCRSRYRCAYFLVFLPLIFVREVSAQRSVLNVEFGLLNCGAIATEVENRVRCPSLPAERYVGLTFDGKWRLLESIDRNLSFTFRALLMDTHLQVVRCDPVPCESVNRFSLRPDASKIEQEFDWDYYEFALGVRYQVLLDFLPNGLKRFEPALGPVFTLVSDCPYSRCGATPMAVPGLWVELRMPFSVCGLTWIPPQGGGGWPAPRWTVVSERSGFKEVGESWPNKEQHDPQQVTILRCGVNLRFALR